MDNCVSTTRNLLKKLGVKYSKEYLEDRILSHPDHPSLLSVTDTLENYQIENIAVKIDFEKLLEMPQPSLVQIKDGAREIFVVISSIVQDKISYFNDKNKLVTVSNEEFINVWTGICLLIEKSKLSQEPGINSRIFNKKIINALKFSSTAMFLAWFGLTLFDGDLIIKNTVLLFFILKLIGFGFGLLLLWLEVDQYNPTLQSFCSGGGKVNCNAVLNSEQAQLFGGHLSVSSVVFAYFFGTLFFIICTGANNLTVLGYLSFMSIPAIIASFYYQAFVIKQWCKFCIGVQAVLLLEIANTSYSGFYGNESLTQNSLLLGALFLAPILAWKLIKPLFEKERENNLYKRGLRKIKNNPDVLNGLLSKSRKIKNSTNGLGIEIKNLKAKYNIIKVCNPYCGPCAKAHPILEELVKSEKINLQIVFTASLDNEHKAEPVRHLLAVDAQGDKQKTHDSLADWYNAKKKDYAIFSKKYPLNGELKKQDAKISAMVNWCKSENITHTPTIFINGHEMPNEYDVQDLKEMLL